MRKSIIAATLLALALPVASAPAQAPPQAPPPPITLSRQLVTDVATYLQSQPYKDVANLLSRMQAEINAAAAPPTTAPAAADPPRPEEGKK